MFSYDIEEIYSVLDELMASKRVIDTSRGPMWFNFPLVEDRIFSRHIYKITKKECEERGIPNIKTAHEEHSECGLWSDEKMRSMEQLPKFIEQMQEKLKKESNLIRKRKFEQKIRELARQLTEISEAYRGLMALTSEFMAYHQSMAYMLWKCFQDIDGNPLWAKWKDMLSEQDLPFTEELIIKFGENEEVNDIGLIRKIARDSQWRVRWKVSNTDISSLFGRDTRDLTITQFMLVYWSQVYDSVYDSMEPPPNKIVDDDDALDKWLKKRSDEYERDIKKKFAGKSTSGVKNSKIEDSPEVFKIVSGYYNEEGEYVLYNTDERMDLVEDIKNLNEPQTRAVQRQGEQQLEKSAGLFIQENEIRKTERAIEATGGTVEKRTR